MGVKFIMATDSRIQKTIDYYTKEAGGWAAAHQGEVGHSWWVEQMKQFNQYLPSGRILEVGSGAGVDAGDLINLGYDYVGIDPSAGMVAIGEERNPKGTFFVASIESMTFPFGSFDGFWAPAVLLHIPKNLIGNNLRKLKSVCKKGAIGFITVMTGDREEEDVPTGRWFAYYRKDELTKILEGNGFEIIDNSGIK